MRQFVGDQAYQALVAGDHCGRYERQHRVLHAAERKSRRQHEDVVATPSVTAVERLDRLHHGLRILEFPSGGLDHARFGIDAGAVAGWRKHQIPDCQGDQVRRNRRSHSKFVVAGALGTREHLGAHHRQQFGRRTDSGGVGYPTPRTVLQRDPRARLNRLGLTVEKRVALSGGLRRIEPLQPPGTRRSGILDAHAVGTAARDRQRRTEDGVSGSELVRCLSERFAIVGNLDARNRQVARVQH